MHHNMVFKFNLIYILKEQARESDLDSFLSSDLQLAIALQQQEFDQQQQEQQREQQQQRNAQQQAVSGSSRLIVGPPQPQVC